MTSVELPVDVIHKIAIAPSWFNKKKEVIAFNEKVKRFDRHVYCAFDYESGFYKVYKKLPFQLWGALGDFDGKDYEIFTIATPAGNPRKPEPDRDLTLLRNMEVKQTPYAARVDSNWKKYWFN